MYQREIDNTKQQQRKEQRRVHKDRFHKTVRCHSMIEIGTQHRLIIRPEQPQQEERLAYS